MGWTWGDWASFRRARLWPGIATPTLTSRTAAACLLVGGLLVAFLTTLVPTSFHSVAVQYANAAVAAVVGVGVLLWGHRLQLWQFHLLVVMSTVQITVSVSQAAEATVAVSFATLYVFIATAGFFVPWWAAVFYVSLAAGSCMVALGVTSAAAWWAGVFAASTTVVIGFVIALLGRIVSGAELDTATGLPNRRGFERLLAMAISRAQSVGQRPALVLLSVDGWGAVRRQFGYRAGDEMLRAVVAAWREVIGRELVLARMVDDEFVVLAHNVTDQEAVALSHRMREAVPWDCSVGVTVWQPGESASDVLSRVDVALRRAKRVGRNRTMLESAGLPPIAVELREALAAGAIEVLYQPIVRLSAPETIVGIEALLRWAPESRPCVTLAEVIEVAENTRLIGALDRVVLRRACLDAQRMQARSPQQRLSLSVNVSGLELTEDGYAARVAEILTETGWPAHQLVLEVTETVLDADTPSSISALHELRARGVRIAIDDFGTGYSSLSRLHTIPTDYLKLEAAFTASMHDACSSKPLLRAIAALAEALDVAVIVEGIETAEQANVLGNLGFDLAQGYFFGIPQDYEAIAGSLAAQ
ncbi:putative bifunctional diguanylate cyclase/phosphodiesterase [Mycobacterium deserti]|uniref:Bifunctional diguanylate cyclase/phosphodiesterase n=1 Tax=Mycobacterium deserti TaxID=2978347 RepID=A0ABT2MKN7_9MYCO|nr:bifunctional diguanylate cyclase/phosphodiesterase [Mycobacterium deserti]MCT7662079.1 bifunctional diguanylate cyclase/phosphodiesterase [Mycobacterium deserti]